MPTLSELPQTLTSIDSDLALIERGGESFATTVASLREPMQPRLTLASGKLLGRVGVFPGGPEPVNIGTGLKIESGTLMVDQATLPSANASNVNVVATGSTTSRNLASRFAESINARDYGARADGVFNDGPALQAAMDAAAARPRGAQVFLPSGTYRIDASFALLRPRSNVVLRGAGRGRSVILVDDSIGAIGGDCITNAIDNTSWLPLSDFHMRDLTVRGRADINSHVGAQMVRLFGTNLSVEDCEFIHSRNMGLVISNSDQVTVRNCRVYRCVADGIAVWDSGNVVIEGNVLVGINDDAISAHCASLGAAPLRSGIVIANNIITESQGIAVLSAKSVVITGNVLRRIMGTGMRIWAPNVPDAQGKTPQFALRITNNIIADVFRRGEPNPRTLVQFYIWVGGGVRNAGTGSAPPGEPAVGTGTVAPLYGTGSGTFYAADNANPAVAAPAGHWNEISGNLLVRTLPAVSAVSDWGYGPEGLWVGDNGDGSGFYNGAITESQLNTMGMLLGPAMRNCRIADNTIQTTGPHGILFNSNTYVTVANQNLDYDGLTIEGNRIVDFSAAAIQGPNAGTHRVLVRHNEIDGDPRFRAPTRGAGGTWSSATGLSGILLSNCSGFVISGNAFRNVATAVRQTGAVTNVVTANTLHCDPAAVGFSVANRGVGTVEPGGAGWLHVIETCDPANALYGRMRSTTLDRAAAQPTAGTYVAGHYVAASAPASANRQTLLGWVRLTTGSGHVAGTDWAAVHGLDGAGLSSPKVTVFTASGTWTRDPSASQVEVELWGAGGGGGSGGVGNAGTALSGGGGGGGAGRRRARFRAADLPASLDITVGAPGAGGGGAGGQGGSSAFGTLLRAHGGGGGAAGNTTAAGGGGGGGDNNPGNTSTGPTGGAGGGVFGANGGNAGAAGGAERVGGGGGGGGALGGVGGAGGYAADAGGGGGGGGGISAGGVAASGGTTAVFNASGTNAGGTVPGGAGTALADAAPGTPATMGGPGGAASAVGPGGAGAAGQNPGGGGGGGGAAFTGHAPGAGGPGGGGLAIVCEW